MTITESLLQEIDIGREGRAQGYSMGLPKIESIIDGVVKAVALFQKKHEEELKEKTSRKE